MEAITENKPAKRGNPNFGAKEKRAGWRPFEMTDPNKIYEFELIDLVTQGKPVDRDNDKPLDSPYPHLLTRPNEGVAYCEESKKARSWRYIVGQPSLWVDEQPLLADLEKREINEMLGRSENQIEFIKGKCLVRGVEQLKLEALLIHDTFDGKPNQYKKVNRMYRLINPDKIVKQQLDNEDLQFTAMKLAHECSEDEMLYAAFTLGIDVSDISTSGINKIRAQFLSKAKLDPSNPKAMESLKFFISVMENPLTKIRYIFSQGITNGIISITQQTGKLTWAAPNTVIMDIDPRGNPVDQLCGMVIAHEELAMQVFEQIEQELNNMAE